MSSSTNHSSIQIAIAWCLAWGTNRKPQHADQIKSWRASLSQGKIPESSAWTKAMTQARVIAQTEQPSLDEIADLVAQYPALGDRTIGLIYGGVTKVKSYVFESADLQEIRGGSALLDRINLVDLPALFHAEGSFQPTENPSEENNLYDLCKAAPSYCDDVRKKVFATTADGTEQSSIADALIPELLVYSTGGNILAFCPAAFVTELCNAIEKRYTTETLTANSCAVGDTFRPVELYVGLLQNTIENTFWHDEFVGSYQKNKALQAYFGIADDSDSKKDDTEEAFWKRKNFGELVGKLTSQFNQRRSGDDSANSQGDRPSHRYPPMFETHPYLMRDDSDIRSAVKEVTSLPDEPKLSEPTARKRRVGQLTKRYEVSKKWFSNEFKSSWTPEPTEDSKEGAVFQSWVGKFEIFLKQNNLTTQYDPAGELFSKNQNIKPECRHSREARSLTEIGDASRGYVAYIYADGNSMGQYIRERIKTPAQYQQFSQDVFDATERSVYKALADHIHPHYYQPDAKSSRQPGQNPKDPVWIHPFEIVTIGGDDVLLIVPANKAMEVAHAIGHHFERILLEKGDRYADTPLSAEQKQKIHRCRAETASEHRCQLSTSSGVLITAVNTPFYYALDLVTQLQKTAKKHLKALTKSGYQGGTVDFLVLKAVTMITSDITAFRKAGLTLEPKNRTHKLKLQAAPYTLHDLDGLIKTVQAIKAANFPKSQLYQIRSLLERGKRTAILNYRYFRSRLQRDEDRQLLKNEFEEAWCAANTNSGNLAPWLPPKPKDPAEQKTNQKKDKTVYETIWRELVELEPFIDASEGDNSDSNDDSDSTVATAPQSIQEAS